MYLQIEFLGVSANKNKHLKVYLQIDILRVYLQIDIFEKYL